ncbi:hypothetical protein QBB34_09755 [Streptomyces stelliscabiei]|uniref:hypothetical protein n=1 Tax=Streptomyces stelliscabiei TaxID=146820 RepID=UPI002FF3A786
MTLTDASLHIAVFLGGMAIAAAVIWALKTVRRVYPAQDIYAGFQAGARGGARLQLRCEGDHCIGDTEHEADGDGGATCVLCGTTRPAPLASDQA